MKTIIGGGLPSFNDMNGLSEEEKKVVDILNGSGSVSVDMISLKMNLQASKVAAVLLNLEFKGIILSLPGKLYRLN